MNDAPGEQEGANDAEGRSEDDVPHVIGLPKQITEQHEPSSDVNSCAKKKEKWTGYEKATVGIAALGVLVVLVYTTLTFWQGRIAKGSLRASGEAAKIQSRATLKLVNWKIDKTSFAANKAPIISFEITNTGPTVAYVVTARYDYGITDRLAEPFELTQQVLPSVPAIIAQGESIPIKTVSLPPISPTQFGQVRNGNYFIFLRIIIEFRDLYGEDYEIRTTGQYVAQSNGFLFPELPPSAADLHAADNCQFAAHRKFNTYRRIRCP